MSGVIPHPAIRALRSPLAWAGLCFLIGADYRLARWVATLPTGGTGEPGWYTLATRWAGNGAVVGLCAVGLWLVGHTLWNRRVELGGKWVLGAVLLTGFWAQIPKLLIGRPRPRAWLHDGLLWPQGSFTRHSSFPSGHTMVSFAVATVLAAVWPRAGWLFFLVATLIAAGRIYGGDHFLTDVLVGGWLGTLIGQFCAGQWREQAGASDA